MTIVVFDTTQGYAYADGRCSSETLSKKHIVVDENYNKLYRFNEKIIGFSGNCGAIHKFFDKHRQGKKALFSSQNFAFIEYCPRLKEFTIYDTIPSFRFFHAYLSAIFMLALSAWFDYGVLTLFSSFIIFFACAFPEYKIRKKITSVNDFNRIYFGSGLKAFKHRDLVYCDSYQSIKGVHLEDKYCNSNINKLCLDGSYWNEDIH